LGLIRAVIIDDSRFTFLTISLVLPLVVVFAQASRRGVGAYFSAAHRSRGASAIRLTLPFAAISVSLNLVVRQ